MSQITFHDVCAPIAEKIFSDIRSLSASLPPCTGVTRLGYSEKEDQTVSYLIKVGKSLGLTIESDAAGNVWMTLPGQDRTLPAVVCGSHADSVLDGGNYDGLAGIVLALCPILWIKARGLHLVRDYRVLVIRCEEQGLIGTNGVLGKLTSQDMQRRFWQGGPTLQEALLAHGLHPEVLMSGKPSIDLSRIAAFFEAHIEQSDKLERSSKKRVGLVSGIRGIRVHRAICCHGVQAHAGAIEFADRHDAVAACARFVAKIYEAWEHELAMGHDLVVTTGAIRTPDTAIFNKIAGQCEMTLDMRSLDDEVFSHFSHVIDNTLQDIAQEMGVTFTMDPAVVIAPNHADASLMTRLQAAADQLGIGIQEMASGAGHDAANFGAAGVPFAMLFIANQNGSHNPREAMKMEDFLAAAHILTQAVTSFDGAQH